MTAGSGLSALRTSMVLRTSFRPDSDGAVIGRPLDAGTFTFAEAETAVEARYDPTSGAPAQP